MKTVIVAILVLAAMAAVQARSIRERRQVGIGFNYPGAAPTYGQRQQDFLHSDAGKEYKKAVVPALCGVAATMGGALGAAAAGFVCAKIPTK
ncbi:hypothetical protein MSG28_015890 [Choristoneura fumiferana]|uniref:Uncharacterized protein n=1 Tax=Choristoneura fumiferana TaxID=7141 RepID=A0ACC0K521_CHOFU|nr:hypothetical protein MSG28_015890 [Choristoneura fumiferana]